MQNPQHPTPLYDSEDDEPLEREELPASKDPNFKISPLTILKDNIGKDLSKITMPVFFNEPMNTLQKTAFSIENTDLLERAHQSDDPVMRMAYMAAYKIAMVSSLEKTSSKPFNPILGETFEFTKGEDRFVAEQVSHHPPMTAFHLENTKGTYRIFGTEQRKAKFTGKGLHFSSDGLSTMELMKRGEVYMSEIPLMFVCNIIFGKPYMDLGGTSKITCAQTGCVNELTFTKRGWSKGTYFRVEGFVSDAKGIKQATIEAKWNEKIVITYKGRSEVVWQKEPYPPKADQQYGFTRFGLQMNYLPKRLERVIAPTDTRRRMDQRLLE